MEGRGTNGLLRTFAGVFNMQATSEEGKHIPHSPSPGSLILTIQCDGARPSCLRCRQCHRACGGYDKSGDWPFRNYDNGDSPPRKLKSIARKCTLPPIGEGGDILPKEVSEEESEMFALQSFVYDYCIVSGNLSRGFLSGLEPMLHEQGFHSDLAKACKAVAFATHHSTHSRPSLLKQAQDLHDEVLCRFARDMAKPSVACSSVALTTAMLLGLYEVSIYVACESVLLLTSCQIIIAGQSDSCFIDTHASGVAAILQADNTPLGILEAVKRYHTDHSMISEAVVLVGWT